jgi:hypothetical protein
MRDPEDRLFEEEVRRLAAELWPAATPGNAVMLQGFERDALFVTEEAIHLLEATTSRRKEKAKTDGAKLGKGVDFLQKKHPAKAVKGWFITRDSVTADQQEEIRKYQPRVVAQSIQQFRTRLVDARGYLGVREKGVFGSAQDPATNSTTELPEYIPLDLLEEGTQKPLSVQDLMHTAREGGRFAVLGDFGAGKSMTLRQLFFAMRVPFLQSESYRFPLHLNLREHHGQTEPAEAIERHARQLGFPYPAHLVRAWRSGLADVLLDGFDELGTAGWTGRTRRVGQLRYSSMTLVRKFMQQTPEDVAVVVAGREHFFDGRREMETSLGLPRNCRLLTLNDFTESQIQTFLSKRGVAGAIPDWFPARPLLLGYLAARGLVSEVIALGEHVSPAEGWDALLDRISQREANIDPGLDGPAVRAIIERLATVAPKRRTAGVRFPSTT